MLNIVAAICCLLVMAGVIWIVYTTFERDPYSVDLVLQRRSFRRLDAKKKRARRRTRR